VILKTDAIVLRMAPYANTSQVVTWMTRDAGRIATLIKGARRPKSDFLGQYDLFYTCELLFYRRGRDGLHIARECCPLASRPRIRKDWHAFACASHLSNLALHTSMDADHQPEIFDFFRSAYDHLDSAPPRLEFLFWFELRLLELLGFGPQLSSCANCQSPLRDSDGGRHGWGAFGILCTACTASGGSNHHVLAQDILAILQRWNQESDPTSISTIRCSRAQLLVFQQIFGTFLEHHLDIRPDCRRIAISMMMPNRA
jgi:DNA repair protein RecO (recombination protein O)